MSSALVSVVWFTCSINILHHETSGGFKDKKASRPAITYSSQDLDWSQWVECLWVLETISYIKFKFNCSIDKIQGHLWKSSTFTSVTSKRNTWLLRFFESALLLEISKRELKFKYYQFLFKRFDKSIIVRESYYNSPSNLLEIKSKEIASQNT